MNKFPYKKILGILLSILFLTINYSPYVRNVQRYPTHIDIFEGDIQTLDFGIPFNVKIEGDNVDVLKFNGNSLKEESIYNMGNPLSIESTTKGSVLLDFKLLGIIPIKQININIDSPKKLIPGGNSIGVSLYTKGALIVGTTEIMDEKGNMHYPSIDAGLRPGDIIETVNGVKIKNAEHLSKLVNKIQDSSLDIEFKRGNRIYQTTIKPIMDANDSIYRLGIWVRDSTAGVGTLTYYDPNKNTFGALGHAITDIDTGSLLTVENGDIMQSKIIDVKQGKVGIPGELIGNFSGGNNIIGNIVKNTNYGIYGIMKKNLPEFYYEKPLPIAYQYSVVPGKAKILTTIDEEGIKEYDIEILKVNHQNSPSSKGIILEVTDPVLLKRTGGIVQGMSGSPIIQNGRIVGAVTHVFVNDPTKGYGIFIEWMLEESEKIILD